MSTGLQADMTVEYVLARWPETAVVFNELKMVCVGCAVAPFCSMHDASADYNIPLETLLIRLNQAIEFTRKPSD